MKKFFPLLILFFVLEFFTLNGCFNKNDEEIIYPLSNLSYSKHIYPLLYSECAYSGCHDNSTIAAGINFQSIFLTQEQLEYQKPTWPFPLVTQGDPDKSMLYEVLKIKDQIPGVAFMPPEDKYVPLSEEQMNAIWKWIVEGANIYN